MKLVVQSHKLTLTTGSWPAPKQRDSRKTQKISCANIAGPYGAATTLRYCPSAHGTVAPSLVRSRTIFVPTQLTSTTLAMLIFRQTQRTRPPSPVSMPTFASRSANRSPTLHYLVVLKTRPQQKLGYGFSRNTQRLLNLAGPTLQMRYVPSWVGHYPPCVPRLAEYRMTARSAQTPPGEVTLLADHTTSSTKPLIPR